MLHTPRLCVDARVSPRWGQAGHEVGEFVDEMAAFHGEEESVWVNRHRTVFLTLPRQVFTGPWKRYNTRVGPTGWALSQAWERQWLRRAPVSFFHRFRPFGFAAEKLTKPVLTTWLPSHQLPLSPKIRAGAWEQHVVPSMTDKAWFLTHAEGVIASSVHVVTPGPRRFLTFHRAKKSPSPHTLLVVSEDRKPSLRIKKAADVWISERAHRDVVFISLKDTGATAPQAWIALLANAELMAYEVTRPLDSGMLAWEAFSWGIPVLFSDKHATLAETNRSPLWSLESFLNDPSRVNSSEFARQAAATIPTLAKADPMEWIRNYAKLYRRVFG